MNLLKQMEAIVENAFQQPLAQPGEAGYRPPKRGDANYYADMRQYAKYAARRTIANSAFSQWNYRPNMSGTSFTGVILEAGVVNRKRGSRRRMPDSGIGGMSLAAAV